MNPYNKFPPFVHEAVRIEIYKGAAIQRESLRQYATRSLWTRGQVNHRFWAQAALYHPSHCIISYCAVLYYIIYIYIYIYQDTWIYRWPCLLDIYILIYIYIYINSISQYVSRYRYRYRYRYLYRHHYRFLYYCHYISRIVIVPSLTTCTVNSLGSVIARARGRE